MMGTPNSATLLPLSTHALGWLHALADGPIRRHRINPGVTDRLWREGLVTELHGPDGLVIVITDAGRAKLAERR